MKLRDRLCREDDLTLQKLELIAFAHDRALERQKLMALDRRTTSEAPRQHQSVTGAPPAALEVAFTAAKKVK